jgi:hypothetical protein
MSACDNYMQDITIILLQSVTNMLLWSGYGDVELRSLHLRKKS